MHNRNCYLVLLKDNDINSLLSSIDNEKTHSLEALIHRTVGTAIRYNGELEVLDREASENTAPTLNPAPDPLPEKPVLAPTERAEAALVQYSSAASVQNMDISQLNETISQSGSGSSLVLNENLYDAVTLATAPGDTVVTLLGGETGNSGGTSTLALGDEATTAPQNVNIYVNLDDEWVCIGTLPFRVDTRSSWGMTWYIPTIETNEIVNLVNAFLGTNMNKNDFTMRYAASANPNDWFMVGTGSNNTTTFGTDHYSESSAKAAKYVQIIQKNGEALKFYTVTYRYWDGSSGKEFVRENAQLVLPAGRDWLADGIQYSGGQTVTITKATTFTEQRELVPCTVTLRYADGTETPLTLMQGTSYQLPTVAGGWLAGDTAYTGGQHVTILGNTVFQEAHKVTLRNADGSVTTDYILPGEIYTLPGLATGRWSVGGVLYSGGQQITVNSSLNIAYVAPIKISYTLGFPTVSGVTVSTAERPAILGAAGSGTAITDNYDVGASAVIRNVTNPSVKGKVDGNGTNLSRMIHFRGWRVGNSNTILSPNTTLTAEELAMYATSGTLSLTGVWESKAVQTASFFIRYDSVAVDTNGNVTNQDSNKYTPEIFASYVGGADVLEDKLNVSQLNTKYNIADVSQDNSVTADRGIRALYGEKSSGLWLYSFPTDDYVFSELVQYANNRMLSVDGTTVKAEDLNDQEYSIRWYVFKCQDDAWHIDGRLVKKESQIKVSKEFFGADDTIRAAENGFYIVAENGTYNNAGVFTPHNYRNEAFKQHVLVTATHASDIPQTLKNQYPNATIHVFDSTADFVEGEAFQWLITGVEFGEHWRITEYPVDVSGNMYYAEYSVYDTDGETSAVAEFGTAAAVIGKTFAMDEDPDQGQLVDFRNYYYPSESILIKKEDADTGRPIGNAVFELWQERGGERNQLKFSYDSATRQYRYDNDGTITRIGTGDQGYTTITTVGFSYSYGPVIVKEVISPTGYAAAPNVTLEDRGETVAITEMVYENGVAVPEAEWADFAEVYTDGSVLIVKNHSTALTTVTANKVWADDTKADSVTLVLQANDTTATNLFPGLPNVRAELNAANGWQYTWTDLPTYANGEPVIWSVKEILVGNETTTADGVSFANWTVTYSPPTRTDSDEDGITDHWSYTVTNSVRRAQLYVVKSGGDGTALRDAAFELVEVDSSGNPVPGAVIRTGVTDSGGLLRFDNLKYATRYRLVETRPPGGYEGYTTPAYLTMAPNGAVTVEDHSHVTAGNNPYMVHVVNYRPLPLPTTGGCGTMWFTALGTALMAVALSGLSRKRKQGRDSTG